MTECRPGEIILLRFPFTDQQSTKKRPAVVVSPVEYLSIYGDFVAIALTTKPQPNSNLMLTEWSQAGLPKASWLKPIIGSFSTAIVGRRIGTIAEADLSTVHMALRLIVSSQFLPSASAKFTESEAS